MTDRKDINKGGIKSFRSRYRTILNRIYKIISKNSSTRYRSHDTGYYTMLNLLEKFAEKILQDIRARTYDQDLFRLKPDDLILPLPKHTICLFIPDGKRRFLAVVIHSSYRIWYCPYSKALEHISAVKQQEKTIYKYAKLKFGQDVDVVISTYIFIGNYTNNVIKGEARLKLTNRLLGDKAEGEFVPRVEFLRHNGKWFYRLVNNLCFLFSSALRNLQRTLMKKKVEAFGNLKFMMQVKFSVLMGLRRLYSLCKKLYGNIVKGPPPLPAELYPLLKW